MIIHELFQEFYADQHGLLASDISLLQMRNGSYATAAIATAFRAFKAGYEANKTGFTAVDMATTAADGFKNGQASVLVELPAPDYSYENFGRLLPKDLTIEAIIQAGGSVKE
jgi:hypothetical protein